MVVDGGGGCVTVVVVVVVVQVVGSIGENGRCGGWHCRQRLLCRLTCVRADDELEGVIARIEERIGARLALEHNLAAWCASGGGAGGMPVEEHRRLCLLVVDHVLELLGDECRLLAARRQLVQRLAEHVARLVAEQSGDALVHERHVAAGVVARHELERRARQRRRA